MLWNAHTQIAKPRDEQDFEDACIELSVVAPDIFSLSGRATMAALIAPALVPVSVETATLRLASSTSSTPHVKAPQDPPP